MRRLNCLLRFACKQKVLTNSLKMKFRAIMTDSMCIQRFNTAITMLGKFCKLCILRIRPDGLFFIAFEEGANKCSPDHRPLAWFTIPREQYFAEYRLVGVSEKHNEIVLSIAPDLLLFTVTNSIKPSSGPKSLQISLTNRKTPCITCEVYTMELNPVRVCLHDIPVEPIGRVDWEDYVIPDVTEETPNVAVVMPGLEGLESMWEMVRKMSKNVIVLVNGKGYLIFKIETDVSAISSNFKDLTVEEFSESQNKDNMHRVRVKSMQFLRLKELCCGTVTKLVLRLYHKQFVMFVAHFNDIVFNCIIPAVKL